jgi:prepilin-type N-terminal cleavage/methylation domain-containing protein
MTKHGFTLVELSIVLVIIGLIVGGVVGGQSLIHSKKISSIISDVNKIKTALNTFELQYDCKPGDMIDAHDYWGTDCNAAEGTCNGDGDNLIETNGNEHLMSWRHLSLAEVIPGNYTGVGSVAIYGENVYKGPFDNTGYGLRDNTWSTNGQENHQWLFYGASYGATSMADASLAPTDAFAIDKKIDDGKRNTGKIIGNGGFDGVSGNVNCASGTSGYKLDYSDRACRLEFMMDAGTIR